MASWLFAIKRGQEPAVSNVSLLHAESMWAQWTGAIFCRGTNILGWLFSLGGDLLSWIALVICYITVNKFTKPGHWNSDFTPGTQTTMPQLLTTQKIALTFWPVLYLLILLPCHTLRLSLSSIHWSSLYGYVPCGKQKELPLLSLYLELHSVFYLAQQQRVVPRQLQKTTWTSAWVKLKGVNHFWLDSTAGPVL